MANATQYDEPEDLLAWTVPAFSPADGWDDTPGYNGPFRRPSAVRFAPSGRTRAEIWGQVGMFHRTNGPALIWRVGSEIRQAWYRHGSRYKPTFEEDAAWTSTEAQQGGPFRYADRDAFKAAQARDPSLTPQPPALPQPPDMEAVLRATGRWTPPTQRPGGVKAAAAAARTKAPARKTQDLAR
jgi:hypothetical protein